MTLLSSSTSNSYDRINNLLTLVNVGSSNTFKLITSSVVICDLYLFHIISFLNPDFRLVNNLISSALDKVTTGTYHLQSVILSVALVGTLPLITGGLALIILFSKLVITQFLCHFNSKDTSQLINGIFNALQKSPKYFNGIANSISCVPSLFAY